MGKAAAMRSARKLEGWESSFAALLVVSLLPALTAKAEQPTDYLPDRREVEAARGRQTLFGPVDPRSRYGLAWFPETLRASEMDLEYSELRLDYFHAEKSGHYQDETKAEIEHAFGS